MRFQILRTNEESSNNTSFSAWSGKHLHVLIKKLRGQVCAVVPYDGLEFRIDPETFEDFLVPQWTKDLTLEFGFEIYFAFSAVVEPKPDDIIDLYAS